MFILSIIITCNCSCSNIGIFSYFSITKICEMPSFYTFFQYSIFYFYKISYMNIFF